MLHRYAGSINTSFRRDSRTCGEFRIFCNHYNTIAHKVELIINIPGIKWKWSYDYIITNTHVLIQDRRFDMAIPADSDWQAAARFLNIIIIRPHKDAIFDHRPLRDLAADPDD